MHRNTNVEQVSGAWNAAGLMILVAAAMGAIDLAVAAIYWNVPLDRILRSIARWIVDVGSMAPLEIAVIGILVQLAMMLLMISGAFPLGRLLGSGRPAVRIAAMGVLYGSAFYIFQFHILLPLLMRHPLPDLGMRWELACFACYAVLLGPCALCLVQALESKKPRDNRALRMVAMGGLEPPTPAL